MQKQIDEMGLVERLKSPTPGFFKKLQTAGLLLATASGYLLATPAPLPAIVTQIAGYMGIAGGVIIAVSQAAVESPATDAGN